MQNVIKSTILGMGLLAGVAVGAYAQTDNVAALPPGAQAPKAPAAAVAPSAGVWRPEDWRIGSTQEKQTQAVRPSEASVGPKTWRIGRPAGKAERSRGPVAGLSRRASELIHVFRQKITGRPHQAPACLFCARPPPGP